MPRTRAKAGTKVKVNFKDVETRRTPPEGDYPLRVAEAVQQKSQGGDQMVVLTFEISAGEYKGVKPKPIYCVLNDANLWKLASILEALGQEVPQDEMDIDLAELIDEEMAGAIFHETYNGRKQANIGDWFPIGDLEANEDNGGKKGKKKKSKKDDAADDEPEDTGKKSKKDKKSKKEPEPEPETKKGKKDKGDKKSKKDKGGKKYSSDAVAEMDEDDLAKVVKKEKLDVDLDDYKSQRKKAGAVIDALEAADLLDD
jgi:hypothetical protein